MMFNKILVVTDDDVQPDDYREVLRRIARYTDPPADIHFMTGPVDILDHSSRKYALGSKMGIDATRKGAGSGPGDPAGRIVADKPALLSQFPELTEVNDSLAAEGIPVLVLGFRKAKADHARLLSEEIAASGLTRGIRYLLLLDPEAARLDLPEIVWLAANNIDPARDCYLLPSGKNGGPEMAVDATRKTAGLDAFSREWPNVIVMDDETIRVVDARWPLLGLGPLLPSPSVKYKTLVFKPGAVS